MGAHCVCGGYMSVGRNASLFISPAMSIEIKPDGSGSMTIFRDKLSPDDIKHRSEQFQAKANAGSLDFVGAIIRRILSRKR